MDNEQKQAIALELASQHMEDFDFLGLVETLGDAGIEYTDDEAEEIYEMVTDAEVRIREVLTW